MNVNDSVALVRDPYFRDNEYHARQYGRVIAMQDESAFSRLGPFALVDWSPSDTPEGSWTPTKPELYHVGNLRVVYAAPTGIEE